MSALCQKDFTLRVRPDLFGAIVWSATQNPVPPGSAAATAAGRSAHLECVSAAGLVFGGGGSVAVVANPCTIINPTTDIQSCLCTIEVVLNNYGTGSQHAGADSYFIRNLTSGITYANNLGADVTAGAYPFAFPIPPGATNWWFQFGTGSFPIGPPWIGGSSIWDVTLEVL